MKAPAGPTHTSAEDMLQSHAPRTDGLKSASRASDDQSSDDKSSDDKGGESGDSYRPGIASLRIDKALWHLRFAPSRAAAQAIVAAGHLRLDGRRVERASTALRVGAVLVLPGPPRIRVIRMVRLPHRRGPPAEAAACYVDMGLDDGAKNATAARPG